eukprot:5037494-Amphidinium_carterae.1
MGSRKSQCLLRRSGTVPEAPSSWRFLKSFALDQNNLSGSIPAFSSQLTLLGLFGNCKLVGDRGRKMQ